jgi:hypothetical protein
MAPGNAESIMRPSAISRTVLLIASLLFAAGCASGGLAGGATTPFDVTAGWRWDDDYLIRGGAIGAAVGLGLALIGNGKGWLGSLIVGGLVGWFVALMILTG